MEEKTTNKKSHFKLTTVIVFTLIGLLVCLGFFISSQGFKGETLPQPNIAGARVLLRIDFSKPFNGVERTAVRSSDGAPLVAPLHELNITTAQVNSFIVVCILALLAFWLTRDLKVKPEGKRQIVAELAVEKITAIVTENMSDAFEYFVPFVAALMALSGLSNLTGLFGWYPPTANVNVIFGWSLVVFILLTYQKMRAGILNYLNGYLQPIFIMAPLNVLGEIATPLSMTFRHFGNICSGLAISALLSWALSGASQKIWSALNVTGFLSDFSILRVGVPAILSIYFDIFSGCLQAFIFCMLTMINIYLAYEDSNETIADKKLKKAQKAAAKAAKAAAKKA